MPEGCRIQIVKATRRGIPVDTYEAGRRETEIGLRDSSGVRIGKAEWGDNDRDPKFADMTISFLPSFKPGFIPSCKFKFCSWVPIQIELTLVPCLELGTRIAILEELVHILLRECRKQQRHIGCYRVPAFIIVAAPGSGKTWTMRQLVYLLARAPTPAGVIAQAPFVMFVQVLASLIRRHDPLHRECRFTFATLCRRSLPRGNSCRR